MTSSPRGINVIPEGDVYRLIIKSTLPAAQKFEEWMMDTVIPSVRNNGGYIAGQEKVATAQAGAFATGEMSDLEWAV